MRVTLDGEYDEMKLNIGCGMDIRPGWINCDNGRDLPKDVERIDASKPLPYPDNTFDEILASHVLEHILNCGDTIYELHRVLKPGGLLTIRVPYGINPDIFHVKYLWPHTLDYLFVDAPNAVNLQPMNRKLFDCLSIKIRRSFWFSYHLKQYLGISFLLGRTWDFPIGKRYEIVWKLRKVTGD